MNNQFQEQEVSTKEFIKKTVEFFQSIGKSWRLLMIGLLTGALVSFILDIVNKKETDYVATISFNLDIGGGASSNAMGQFGGLASAFGVGGGQQSQTGDLLSGSNFPVLAKSRIVFEKALMTNVVVEGDTMLMANYYKDSSDIAEMKWEGSLFKSANDKAINYRFVQKDPEEFTREENEIITSIYDYLAEQTFFEGRTGSSLTDLSVINTNEILAKVWAETLLNATQTFYKEIKTAKTKNLLREQESRLDSLQGLMLSSDNRLGRIAYQNPNIIDPNAKVRESQVGRNNNFYSSQFYSQLANVETLNRLLYEQTPILTIIVPIRLPLLINSGGLGQSYKVGSILGLIIALVVTVLRNTYKEIVADTE